jgi:hypothetical protein
MVHPSRLAIFPALAIVFLRPAPAWAQDVTEAQVTEAVTKACKEFNDVLAELRAAEETGEPRLRADRIDAVRASRDRAVKSRDSAVILLSTARREGKIPAARLDVLRGAMDAVDTVRDRIADATESLGGFDAAEISRVAQLIPVVKQRRDYFSKLYKDLRIGVVQWNDGLEFEMRSYGLELPDRIGGSAYSASAHAAIMEPRPRFRAVLDAFDGFLEELGKRPGGDPLTADSREVQYLRYLEALILCAQRDIKHVRQGRRLLYRVVAFRYKVDSRTGQSQAQTDALKKISNDATQLDTDLYNRLTERWTTEVRPFAPAAGEQNASPAVPSWERLLEEFRTRLLELERKERGA